MRLIPEAWRVRTMMGLRYHPLLGGFTFPRGRGGEAVNPRLIIRVRWYVIRFDGLGAACCKGVGQPPWEVGGARASSWPRSQCRNMQYDIQYGWVCGLWSSLVYK